jgi:hypothetical protein
MDSEEGRENKKMRQPKIKKIVSEKTTFEVRTNQFVKLFWLFCKTNFFRGIPFPSELWNWLFRETRNAPE